MTNEDQTKPDLEEALDGLITAANYCDQKDHHDLSYVISHLYQLLGERELGEKEWYGLEEVFPVVRGEAEVRLDDSSYQGDIEMELWHITAAETDFPTEDADVFVEFWDNEDIEASGELYFSASETKNLVIELLKALNQELDIVERHEDGLDEHRERVREIIDEDRELFDVLDDQPHAEEVLDWLCWGWATDGERFYPSKETAEECIEGVDKAGDEEALAWEEGYHSRAYTEAVERFDDLEARGFDPVQRTERHIGEARDRDLDLPDIDWEWWETTQDQEE